MWRGHGRRRRRRRVGRALSQPHTTVFATHRLEPFAKAADLTERVDALRTAGRFARLTVAAVLSARVRLRTRWFRVAQAVVQLGVVGAGGARLRAGGRDLVAIAAAWQLTPRTRRTGARHTADRPALVIAAGARATRWAGRWRRRRVLLTIGVCFAHFTNAELIIGNAGVARVQTVQRTARAPAFAADDAEHACTRVARVWRGRRRWRWCRWTRGGRWRRWERRREWCWTWSRKWSLTNWQWCRHWRWSNRRWWRCWKRSRKRSRRGRDLHHHTQTVDVTALTGTTAALFVANKAHVSHFVVSRLLTTWQTSVWTFATCINTSSVFTQFTRQRCRTKFS